MGSRGIREQRGVAAIPAPGVKDGQPRLTKWIKTSRRNLLEFPSGRLLSIFAVDIEEFRHTGWLARDDRHPYTPQPVSQGIPDASEALGAEACDRRQSAIVSRGLEVGESLESEFFVQPVRKYTADSRG